MQEAVKRVRGEMGLSQPDAFEFVKHARNGAPFNKLFDYKVPHAQGREGLWETLLTGSGRPTTAGNLDEPFATDLFTTVRDNDDTLIDVQDSFRGKGRTEIGIYKNLNPGIAQEVLQSNPDATMADIARMTAEDSGRFGNDKLLQTNKGQAGSLPRDRNMRTEFGRGGKPTYRKDFLVGGQYSGDATFNPQMFDKGYVADLDALRPNILGRTPSQLRDMGISVTAA